MTGALTGVIEGDLGVAAGFVVDIGGSAGFDVVNGLGILTGEITGTTGADVVI